MTGLTLPPRVSAVGVSLHPAFSLRSGSPQFLPLIATSMARALRWAGLGTAPARDYDIRVDPSLDDAARLLRDAPVVAIDVETPKDQPTTITIVGIGYGDRQALVWPWSEPVAAFVGEILGDPAKVKVGHNFAYDTKAFHAAGLDVAWPVVDTIQAAALAWPPFAEVKDRPWLRLPLCVTRIADGIPYWKQPETPEAKALYRRLFPGAADWQHPLLYCGLDCVFTWRLWAALRTILSREGMLPLLEETVAPAAPVLIRLEETGIPLDEPKRRELRAATEIEVAGWRAEVAAAADAAHRRRLESIRLKLAALDAEIDQGERTCPTLICPEHPDYCGQTKRAKCSECARVYAEAAPWRAGLRAKRELAADGRVLLRRLGDAFDSESDDSWRWLLFDGVTGLGLKPTAYTGKRHLAKVDADAIETLARRHPGVGILKQRVAIQHAQRRLSNVLGVKAGDDGRVHFAYSMHRTETGRIASGSDDAEADKPRWSPGNAQNIPDRDRIIYRPLRPDFVFVQGDWSQIEARVMAWLADERTMIAAFAAGEDLHALNAAALFGCAPEAARTHLVRFGGQMVQARWAAKRATHGWDYGLGAQKTARMYGIKVTEAAALIDAYFRRWPGLRRFQEATVAAVEHYGSLRNPFGRLLRFHRFRRDPATGQRRLLDREEALAFLPQSAVGDMCKAVLPALEGIGALTTATLVTTTHDSFLWECHRSEVALLVQQARAIMERPWREIWLSGLGNFTCPVDFSVGNNWGKEHRHRQPPDPKACPDPCPMLENREGLRGVTPSASTAASSAEPSAA